MSSTTVIRIQGQGIAINGHIRLTAIPEIICDALIGNGCNRNNRQRIRTWRIIVKHIAGNACFRSAANSPPSSEGSSHMKIPVIGSSEDVVIMRSIINLA